MEMDNNSDIVIVGGGICGLATALALHRKDVRSIVLERSKKLRTTGAAIIIRHNGWRALDHLGIASKLRPTAIPLHSCHYSSLDDGCQDADIPVGNGEMRVLRRKDLIEALVEEILPTLRFDSNVVSITMDPVSAFPILVLQDGSLLKPKVGFLFSSNKVLPLLYALQVVIGCDGINSCIAKMLEPVSIGSFSTCAVRGLTRYENTHELGNQFHFLDKPSHNLFMGQFPLSDKLVYWFITKKSTSQDSMVSQDPVLIKQSAMEAMNEFPQQSKDMVEKSDLSSLHLTDLRHRAPWNLLRSRLHRGTVTVAGDAMHAMGPFTAQGGCASLEDAVVLARSLADKMAFLTPISTHTEEKSTIEAALQQYVKARKSRVMRLCIETFLTGIIRDTSSKAVRFIAIALMAIFFPNPNACADYDCGHL